MRPASLRGFFLIDSLLQWYAADRTAEKGCEYRAAFSCHLGYLQQMRTHPMRHILVDYSNSAERSEEGPLRRSQVVSAAIAWLVIHRRFADLQGTDLTGD